MSNGTPPVLTRWRRVANAWKRTLVIALLATAFCVPVHAEQAIYLAGAERENLTSLVDSGITERFGDSVVLRAYTSETPDDALVLALGPAALAEVLANNSQQPLVTLFVSSTYFRAKVSSAHTVTAVFNDPPLLRQARLGQLILPRARRIALLASPDQSEAFAGAIEALEEEGMEARLFVVPSSDDLIRHLSRALSYGDFLLGTPDEMVYNRNTIKHLLLTSYRQNRLVIGPTRPYVRAGAVASTFTSASQQVAQGLEAVATYFEEGSLPPPDHAKEFSVTVNRQVARSMNIPIPSDEQLADELRRLEAGNDD